MLKPNSKSLQSSFTYILTLISTVTQRSSRVDIPILQMRKLSHRKILNSCLDCDEIQFMEDGSWCPMKPKKEASEASNIAQLKREILQKIRRRLKLLT
uniref:Uncharacterized protein n=1 Tax=Spermophilus dauricus TaxID=99837 RepID=A0A8C9QLQ9_SPEDA